MEGDEAQARRGKESLSGGHLCHVCGYQYPNANPSAKLRRSHRKNCRKTPAADGEDVGAVEEEREDAAESNAGGVLQLGRGGAELEGNGGASEVNGGSALRGSAKGDADLAEDKGSAEHATANGEVQIITDDCSVTGVINCNDSVEITKGGNETNLQRACTIGSQNKVAEHCPEISPLAVGHLAEREDSLDEYQDASPFLHQSDSEAGAAEAHKSDLSIEEIKNSRNVSLGASVDATQISVETCGSWKDQFSGEPNMTDLSADSKVGKDGYHSENSAPGLAEPAVKLDTSYDSSVNVHCDNTYMVDCKPDKTPDFSEFIGDVNGSVKLISDLESQSSCTRKEEDFMGDSMDALHIISEVLLSPKGEASVESETGSNSRIDLVQTGGDLKLINAVSTLTDCSSQYKHDRGTSDVQLTSENLYLGNSVCSIDGYQSDHVKEMDSMLGSVDENICSEGNLVKGGELGFSCEEWPQHIEQLVNIAEENPLVEKPSGFSEEEVCIKEICSVVPAIDQVSASQENDALLMDTVPSVKNPFIVDDTKSDDLFELATESYHSEVSNVAESKLQVDLNSLALDQLTVSSQICTAEGQHSVISDDRGLAVLSTTENGLAVGTEDLSVSSSSDPTKDISLHEVTVNHSLQEDGERTSGINFMPPQVFPPGFSAMPTFQEINALKSHVDEKTPFEDMGTKDMTLADNADNVEEKRETEDINVKEMNSVLKTNNVEEEKLTDDTSADMNAIQHKDDTGKEMSAIKHLEESEQAKYTGAKGVRAVVYMENADGNNQTEDTGAKEMKAEELKADNAGGQKQTEDMDGNNQAKGTRSKETNTVQSTANAEEKKQTEEPVDKEGNEQNEEISVTVTKQKSERVHVPLKVLLAEASVESKEKKTSAKERVLSFKRRVSRDDSSSAKSGSPKAGADDKFWSSPARLPENNAEKRSKGRKQPWMPFICCHSVH